MIEAFKILWPKIKDFSFEEVRQFNGFDKKKVTNIYLSSSSYIRKDFTMKRIRDIIEELKLPLVLSETELEATPLFQIKAK